MKAKRLFLVPAVFMGSISGVASKEPTRDSQAASVSLYIMDKEIWTLQVKPKKIQGDRVVLNTEGDVMYGFFPSGAIRLINRPNRLDGRLGPSEVMLSVDQAESYVTLRGTQGPMRLFLSATADSLILGDSVLLLQLETLNPNATPQVLSDQSQQIQLHFSGCSASIMINRLDLLVTLARLILPRIEYLHDLTAAGLTSITTDAQARPSLSLVK